MKFLAVVLALTPLFADDPLGFVVWKNSDLKQQANTRELHDAEDLRAVLVHQSGDGEVVASEFASRFLIIESGEATVVVGGAVQSGSIVGGDRTAVTAGDVVHIPARAPYQLLVTAGTQVTYLAITPRAGSDDSPPVPLDPNAKKPSMGIELGGGYRACVAGDNTPSGTTVDGYRKLLGYNFMGHTCVWSKIEDSDSPASQSKPGSKPLLGTDMGSGFRSCVQGDDTPNGTIIDGYRKEFHTGPFGSSCAWEKIR